MCDPCQRVKMAPSLHLFLTWSFWFGYLGFISKCFLNHFKLLLFEVPLRHHILGEGSLYPLRCFSNTILNTQIMFQSTAPDGPLSQDKTQALAQPKDPLYLPATSPDWIPPAHLPGFVRAAHFYSHWNSLTRWLFLVNANTLLPVALPWC